MNDSINTHATYKPTLLLVDDSAVNLNILVSVLRDDYHLSIAKSGKQALRILEIKKTPDMVLLDIMMPEMDGYEVMAVLKANPLTQRVPIIFLTAMSQSVDQVKGLKMGAVDFITKPKVTLVKNIMIQVMINLIKNAYEAIDMVPEAKEKNIIIQTAQKTRKDRPGIQVEIHDTGIGVAAAFIDDRMPPGWDGIETTKHETNLKNNVLISSS